MADDEIMSSKSENISKNIKHPLKKKAHQEINNNESFDDAVASPFGSHSKRSSDCESANGEENCDENSDTEGARIEIKQMLVDVLNDMGITKALMGHNKVGKPKQQTTHEKSTVDKYLADEEEEEEKEEGELDWVEEFAREYGAEEDTGPAVADNLASLVERMVTVRMPEEKSKPMLDSLLRPANVPMLVNPRVNGDIWSKLKTETKSTDLKISKIGEKVVKMLVANINVTAKLSALKASVLGETRKAVKDLTKLSLDAIQVGAIALQDINQKRRDLMRNDLHPSYRSLCNTPKEESDTLFGEDLAEKVKSINQAKNLGNKITETPTYNKGSKKAFLGRGRYQPYHNRQQPQQHQGQYRQNNRGKGRGNTNYKKEQRQ